MKIEQNYDVEDISYKHEKVWPYLRLVYGFKTTSSSKHTFSKQAYNKRLIKRLVDISTSMFYGFSKFFQDYEYIIYGNTDGKKEINGLYHDRLAEGLMHELGHDKVLFIEQLNKDSFYPSHKLHHKNTVSYSFIELLSALISRLYFYNNYKNDALDKINKDLGLKVNYALILKQFMASVYLNNLVLKIYKPKVVFITNYTQKAVIKAAKDLGIEVIELQHGVINKHHHGYNIKKQIDADFYPDAILTTGKTEQTFFSEDSAYIQDTKKIYPVGSYYIDWMNQNFDKSLISKRFNHFQKIVCVTLQWTVAKEMIAFIDDIASIEENILFILIPRVASDLSTYQNDRNNIIILKEYNCYEILMSCDFHITSYSSCGYEAPSLGIANIFVDLKHPSEETYVAYIEEHNYNYHVSNTKELACILNSDKAYVPESLKEENSNYIVPHHQTNIESFVEKLNNCFTMQEERS